MRILDVKINRIGTFVSLTEAVISVSGCLPPRCNNCSLIDFRQGKKLTDDYLAEIVREINVQGADYVHITGGEPLDQHPDYLQKLLRTLYYGTEARIFLHTCNSWDGVPHWVFPYVDVIKPNNLGAGGSLFRRGYGNGVSGDLHLYFRGIDFPDVVPSDMEGQIARLVSEMHGVGSEEAAPVDDPEPSTE